ncbi:hypothetical protein [uncultured Xanthomonas sp.]|uniref:hypothetical protein n=1 Tax=uncultured Xanthomonas sp. TaxID=152831 RepID=UPI0025CD7673|nr:hypothetical protein [uncultured Xanthomonas sp.]
MSTLEERVTEIERRLALLEAAGGNHQPDYSSAPPPLGAPKDLLVVLSVSKKRFDRGDYEEHIWFDCVYTLSKDSKPTRAVKGAIEFCDLFGDVKFRLQVTINEPMTPGRPLSNPGIGFTFNQFISEHQWMLSTDLSNMKCSFVASNAIYTDGTSEAFA